MRGVRASMINVSYFGDTSCVAEKKIEWPEMTFPPINLWVLAASPVLSNGFENTHNYRSQRLGMKGKHANARHYFGYAQMKTILAMHGGKQ